MNKALNMRATTRAMLAIILLGSLVYANALGGKFVWDDYSLIKHNKYIQDRHYLSKLFTESTGAGAGTTNAYYRPVELLTYMLDYSVWKLNARGYHLTNIILHLAMSLSVFWLLYFLFDDALLSFFASALYVMHPIHVAAVAYITGRPEIPSAFFMVCCIIAYDRFVKRKKITYYALALASAVLALLSRENSIIVPLLLLLWHYASKNRVRLWLVLPFFGMTAFYILLRLTVFSFTRNYGAWLSSAPLRIPGFFAAVFDYLRLLIMPMGLHAARGEGGMVFGWNNPKVVAGVLVVCALAFFALRKRTSHRLAHFSVLWFFAALLPYTNIYPRLPFYMNDHHMYLPSIGFFLLSANGLCFLFRRKPLRAYALFIFSFAVVFYAARTMMQNSYWREPIAFYEKTLAYAPRNAKLYLNLGQTYYEIGAPDKAIAAYEQALELEPNDANAHYNIGAIRQQKGDYAHAVESFTRVLAIDPYFVKAYNNLGVIYLEMGKTNQSIASFHQALKLSPGFAHAWNNLGTVYALRGEYKKAATFFREALRLNPSYDDARSNLQMATESIK